MRLFHRPDGQPGRIGLHLSADENFQNLAKVIVDHRTMACDQASQLGMFNAGALASVSCRCREYSR